MTIQWLPASACFPPHGITHPDKAVRLLRDFIDSGWDMSQPVLIGYPYGEGIQLLSGSHRWAAAAEAGIRIPVHIVPYSEVWASHGHLERWSSLMRTGGEHGQRGE